MFSRKGLCLKGQHGFLHQAADFLCQFIRKSIHMYQGQHIQITDLAAVILFLRHPRQARRFQISVNDERLLFSLKAFRQFPYKTDQGERSAYAAFIGVESDHRHAGQRLVGQGWLTAAA